MSESTLTPSEFFPARADILVPAGVVGPESFSFQVQAFVVRSAADIILVDTLMRDDHVAVIETALEKAGATFDDIRYVVLTHHHPDHTGGLAETARRAPQAQILCGAEDAVAISRATGIAVDAVRPDDKVVGLEVVAAPGHTPGHLCLFDAPSSTMLLGDSVGNPGQIERAPRQFTEDPDQYERTLRSIAERNFENALPSHGEPITDHASRRLLAFVRNST